MADLSRDFWIRETGMGQQVALFHDIYDDDDYPMQDYIICYCHLTGKQSDSNYVAIRSVCKART
jgi:hypothetical protein